MPIRFTQKHIEQLPLDDLTMEQFLNMTIKTSKQLGWEVGSITERGFIAYTKNGLFLWNAQVKLEIKNGVANLQSQSLGNEIIDLENNKKNLQSFIVTLSHLKKTLPTNPFESRCENC